mmetsp:Transcript_24258/g.27940  ORF Transcript_24258/g.27940 Transcript_24258/m.27940 type:complete len:109 (-) Transcript_24258:59-385(-)
MGKRKKPSFYAVRVGRKPGIYLTWEDCKKQTDKFGGTQYKGFVTKDAAESYLRDSCGVSSTKEPSPARVNEIGSNSNSYSSSRTEKKIIESTQVPTIRVIPKWKVRVK